MRSAIAALVVTLVVFGTPAASAKDFEPGDLHVCNHTRCVAVTNAYVTRLFSSFLLRRRASPSRRQAACGRSCLRTAAGQPGPRARGDRAARPCARLRDLLRAVPPRCLVSPAGALGAGIEARDDRVEAVALQRGCAKIVLSACIARGEAIQSVDDSTDAGRLGPRNRGAQRRSE